MPLRLRLRSDGRGLTPGEGLVLAGAGLMLLASILPWYEVDLILGTGTLDAWQEPGLVWSAGAVTLSALLAILVFKRTLDPRSLPELTPPLSWGLVWGVGGALPLACVALKLATDSDFVAYGFYVAFVAAGLQAVGGVLLWLEERRRD
jgi:hypothetical protein